MKKYNLDRFYIHAPYYTNFASDDEKTRKNSIRIAREELERGTVIGAKYVIIHIGSAKESDKETAVKKAGQSVKEILDGYDGDCELLLENSAGAGNIIGSAFEEIAVIMSAASSPKLGGICFDTCHAFASGYKINRETFREFDKIIGLQKIKFLHVNDSMVELGKRRDRHDHIGAGKIGRKSFETLSKIKEFKKVDLVTETKHDKVENDIKILKKIRDEKK